MSVAIVDYGSGNLRSAAKGFEKFLSTPVVVTADATEVACADRIVLPGQGAFADCFAGLSALDGMIDVLREAVLERAVPFFGICVGMQLMATAGLEHGRHDGLDWIGGEVVPMNLSNRSLKIPHMGWNELKVAASHPVLDGVQTGDHVYFVHSYHFEPKFNQNIVANTTYSKTFCSVVENNNIFGTQFHPEKSSKEGIKILKNFIDL